MTTAIRPADYDVEVQFPDGTTRKLNLFQMNMMASAVKFRAETGMWAAERRQAAADQGHHLRALLHRSPVRAHVRRAGRNPEGVPRRHDGRADRGAEAYARIRAGLTRHHRAL